MRHSFAMRFWLAVASIPIFLAMIPMIGLFLGFIPIFMTIFVSAHILGVFYHNFRDFVDTKRKIRKVKVTFVKKPKTSRKDVEILPMELNLSTEDFAQMSKEIEQETKNHKPIIALQPSLEIYELQNQVNMELCEKFASVADEKSDEEARSAQEIDNSEEKQLMLAQNDDQKQLMTTETDAQKQLLPLAKDDETNPTKNLPLEEGLPPDLSSAAYGTTNLDSPVIDETPFSSKEESQEPQEAQQILEKRKPEPKVETSVHQLMNLIHDIQESDDIPTPDATLMVSELIPLVVEESRSISISVQPATIIGIDMTTITKEVGPKNEQQEQNLEYNLLVPTLETSLQGSQEIIGQQHEELAKIQSFANPEVPEDQIPLIHNEMTAPNSVPTSLDLMKEIMEPQKTPEIRSTDAYQLLKDETPSFEPRMTTQEAQKSFEIQENVPKTVDDLYEKAQRRLENKQDEIYMPQKVEISSLGGIKVFEIGLQSQEIQGNESRMPQKSLESPKTPPKKSSGYVNFMKSKFEHTEMSKFEEQREIPAVIEVSA